MRPVAEKFPISQLFGSGATQGIVPNKDPDSGWPYYVWLYGNYQPFGHAGLDIACPVGTPIRAIADGTVIYAGWSEDLPGAPNKIRKWLFYYNFGGKLTLIQHNGWISAVAHQSDNSHVKVGDRVKEGQIVGLSGNTKTRTSKVAAHVHVEALVYMDYRTNVRSGVIYGRVDPSTFFGGLAAQGTITTATPQEEPLVPNESDKVFWPIEGDEKVSLNELLNSIDRKSTAALASITGLLSVQLADPTEPGKSYSLADWIVWSATNAKLAAGSAGKAVENTNPATLSKAIADGAASVDAKAIADQLQITIISKEGA